MKALIATLYLTLALLVGSVGSAFGLPECEGSPARSWSILPFLQDMSKNWDECEGSFTYGDGGKYVGEWWDGKRNGQGTLTANGVKYVGEFRNDRRHGQGITYHADGTVDKEGIWKEDKFQNAKKVTPPVIVGKSPAKKN